jgi:hypothetical protein
MRQRQHAGARPPPTGQPVEAGVVLVECDGLAHQPVGREQARLVDAVAPAPSQCPYSRMAFRAIQRLEQQHGGQLRFVLSHSWSGAGRTADRMAEVRPVGVGW